MKIAFAMIGFGEVGSIFARDLMAGPAMVDAYDTNPVKGANFGGWNHRRCSSVHEALETSNVVFVAVTAGSSLEAMRSLSGGLKPGALVVDFNSVSPATKLEASRIVEQAGGRYVEAAVMASVPSKGLRTPILLGGPHAEEFASLMRIPPWKGDLTCFSPEIGRASSVKMCRSVMIKGLEALISESMLAARHYGVEADVLATLGDTIPHADWAGLARTMMSRALIHGKRRAEEMREVAVTVADAGVEPLMTRAIVERQELAWRWGAAMGEGRNAAALDALLDGVSAVMQRPRAAE